MPAKKKAVKKAAKKATKKAAPKKAAKKTVKKAAKKVAKKAAVKKVAKKAAAPKKKTPRKPNAAFMKAMTPSADLAAVVGAGALPRTEVTKKIWAYIKKNGLQDKKNKREINADDKLKKVFGGKAKVNMFEMTKLVSKHLK
jgi:chromatin remodeling complex protein RSC6